MTFKDIVHFIGTEMFFRDKGLHYLVVIKDFRMRYGMIDALVTPVGGKGEIWVVFGNLLGKDRV